MKKMKIAINCAELDLPRIDGTRVYLKNLLDRFGTLDKTSEFLLYHKDDFNPLLAPKIYPNYTERKIPYPFVWTQTRLAYELKADKPDVCWMPIQQLPLIGPRETKYVVTIHDLAFKYFPDHFPFGDRFKHNFFASSAIRRADHIIVVSQNTKNDILKFFPRTNPDKVSVIYHGVEKKENSEFRIQNSEFILYVGAIQPRKNLITLIKAFEVLKKRKQFKELKLVIAGEPAWKSESTMQAIQKSPAKDHIELLGKVSFERLNELYKQAKVFVFPSLYEGFGLPMIEAMQAGTPVIAADNSSLKEIAINNSAKLFPSRDFQKLAETIEQVLTSEETAQGMKKNGARRAADFSWDKCAKQTLDVIKKC